MAEPGTTPTNYKSKGEIGASGTYIINGLITGEEYNRKLTGRLAIDEWEKMRRGDPTVAAILRAVKFPIMAAEYDIEPGGDTPLDEEIAAHVENNLFNVLNWHEVIRQAFLMFDFGFEVMEKVFDIDPQTGLWILKKLAHRKQSTILFWSTIDNQPGVRQFVPGTFQNVSIPREKLVVFTNDKEGDNFEGISLIRAAYIPYYFKTSLIKVQAIGLEKQSVGVPYVKPPSGDADPADVARAKQGAANMRANQGAYVEIPKDWEMGFMDMKANSTADPTAAISYHDRQIAKSVLAQFLDLGSHGSSGSRAVSTDQTELFNLSLEAAAKNFVHTLNEEVIKQLVDLNWTLGPDQKYPKLTFGKIGDNNVQQISEALNKLMTVGAISQTVEVEQASRKILHLPELTEDQVAHYDEIKTKPQPATPPGTTPAPANDSGGTANDNPNADPNGDPQGPADKQSADKLIERAQALRSELLNRVDGIHAAIDNH